ncbi:MAG: MogA/MoaB family molybdenum cofactor biosynthesis protein [Planctomycetes bacterium]|nr:MogA/MoaB family molybdenum cofactor biosynthesis protein [Planctomycetota bacterium]
MHLNPSHENQASDSVTCVVLTISDTRTVENDTSGSLIRNRLEQAAHRIVVHDIIPDDRQRIVEQLQTHCANPNCQCILLTGGTGIAPRDNTFEAVAGILEKRLDGFGELFRMLSFQEIGPRAMLSRAIAGTRGRTLIYSLPGSTAAVQLAMDRLILPTLSHAVALLSQ